MSAIKGRFILPHPPILVPEVGKEQAHLGEKTLEGYTTVGKAIQKIAPKNIIIISPHAQGFYDKFYINRHPRISGDLAQFGHKEVLLGFDNAPALGERIEKKAKAKAVSAGSVTPSQMRQVGFDYPLDHGIIVPLYFINHFYHDYRLLPISITALGPKEHYRMGEAIAEAIEECGEDTVVIASGDLSHKLKEDGPYGFAQEGVIFDETVEELLKNGDLGSLLNIDSKLEEKAAQCGLYGFWMLLGTLEGYTAKTTIYSHEAPFGVGYMTAALTEEAATEVSPLDTYLTYEKEKLQAMTKEENPPLALARTALAYYLDNRKEMPIPQDFPKEWQEQKGGVFVSFKKEGNLRGCIGTLAPTQPSLAEEIISNAIAAGTRDFRFSPITPGEVGDLTVSVDVLSPAEPIEDAAMLNPKSYGVIVESGAKRGVLLPDLEGIDTAEEQIRIAREKAGIPFYKKVKLQRFQVTRYE